MPLRRKSFRAKIFYTLTLPLFIIILSGNILLAYYMKKVHRKILETELLSIANTFATSIEIERFMPDSSEKTMDFSALDMKMKRFLGNIGQVRSVYIMVRKNDEDFYVVAGASTGNDNKTILAGNSYAAENFPGIMMGLVVPFVTNRIYSYGKFRYMTAYVPVRDSEGKPFAVLKMDYDVTNITKVYRMIYSQVLGIVIVLTILVAVAGFFISRQISVPLTDLVQGIRDVQKGNFESHIPVRDNDEFGRLARAFNQMTTGLKTSRKLLDTYLYRTMRSLVTILEARDSYTKGHSERVAFYSEMIARKMNVPEKKIKMLREIALLHDIGKLGISESILQKIEPLTEEEREMIRKHPSIGEEILRPVFFEKDALDIVRQHHERFDGTGYPDGLAGDSINFLAQILTVADAYDAMRSARAYRTPMSQSAAIDELKQNSGTQFNPKIVNVFIEILEKEMKEIG